MAEIDTLNEWVFVVFSDDWGRHPSSCQHLFRRIASRTDVIWVNTVGLRTPRLSLYDIKRALQVLGGWVRPKRTATQPALPAGTSSPETASSRPRSDSAMKVHVVRPLMWPSFQSRWAQHLNQWLLLRAVRRALQSHGSGRKALLVSTLPIVPKLFRADDFARKVYYCVDDFTEWHGVDGAAMRRLEAKTLAACDVLIATSTPILNARQGQVPRASLLTHGVDVEHFAQAEPVAGSPVAALAAPRIGMFGVFDRRVDEKALRATVQALPSASFCVIGPVIDWPQGAFSDLPNLHFLGPMPYAQLPGHVAHFDLCMLPYVVDKTTVNINPLKLKEYLATGRPVICTPLPEAERLAALPELAGALTLADSAAFAQTVVEALARPRPAASTALGALRRESWEAKTETFLNDILKDL